MSMLQKFSPLLILVILFAILPPLSIDMYLSGISLIKQEFNTSPEAATATVSIFIAGLGLGQLFAGPLSDRIGRRPSLKIGLGIFIVSSILAACATSIELLILARFFQALGASAIAVSGRALIRDKFDTRGTASMFSTVAMVSSVAPVIAPSLGAFIIMFGSWRYIFYVLTVFGLLLYVLTLWGLAETRSLETEKRARDNHPLLTYKRLLANRTLQINLFIASLNTACFFTYLATAPLILMEAFGLSATQFGLVFALNAFALMGANQINRRMLRKHEPSVILEYVSTQFIVLAILCLIFALTNIGGLPVLLLLLFFVIGSTSIVQANTLACALAVDEHSSGSIVALFGAIPFAIGALMSVIAGWLFDGTAFGTMIIVAIGMFGAGVTLFFMKTEQAEQSQ